MSGAPASPGSTDRPKSPVDQWFELFVYAPLGFALDARQLLPRFIDRGRSQVALARVVGRYAVRKGSNRAGDYLGQSQEQVGAMLQAFGLVGDDHEPAADPTDIDEFEADVLLFESPPSASATTGPSPPVGSGAAAAEPPPAADSLAIPDYDNLSASQVVPRLGGLTTGELDALRRYESAKRGRKTILNKIAQLRSA